MARSATLWQCFSYNKFTGKNEKKLSVWAKSAREALASALQLGYTAPMVEPVYKSEQHAAWYIHQLRLADLKAGAA